jgi:uncharacterized protein
VPGSDPALLAALRRVLAEGPPLALAVLFGSRATGRATPRSDVDIGIIPADPALSLADELLLTSDLSGATGTEVDLVRLDREDPLTGRAVALDGVCLFEAAPGLFAAYRARAVSHWIDFEETIAPHRDRFLRRLARGGRP